MYRPSFQLAQNTSEDFEFGTRGYSRMGCHSNREFTIAQLVNSLSSLGFTSQKMRRLGTQQSLQRFASYSVCLPMKYQHSFVWDSTHDPCSTEELSSRFLEYYAMILRNLIKCVDLLFNLFFSNVTFFSNFYSIYIFIK